MRVAKAWQDDAQDLLEDFAQGLLDTRGLTREDAFDRMEDFLSRYFFTMIQGISSPNPGHNLVPKGGGKSDSPAEGNRESEGEGEEGKAGDAQKSRDLGKALKEMDRMSVSKLKQIVLEAPLDSVKYAAIIALGKDINDESVEDLKNQARELKIKGFSKMSKEELIDAIKESKDKEENEDEEDVKSDEKEEN